MNLPVLTAALAELETNPLREPGGTDGGESFGGPMLLLRGGKSRYVEDADQARVRAFFPAARVETIAAAGHNPHMETREEFCSRVTDFLGE